MKMDMKQTERLFQCSLVSITLMSVTFLLMPVANHLTGGLRRVFLFMLGVVFWLSLAAGYGILILIYRNNRERLKQYSEISDKTDVHEQKKDLIPNREVLIADLAIVVAVITGIILWIWGKTSQYLIYVVLAVLVEMVNMHFLFNAKIYKMIKSKEMEP